MWSNKFSFASIALTRKVIGRRLVALFRNGATLAASSHLNSTALMISSCLKARFIVYATWKSLTNNLCRRYTTSIVTKKLWLGASLGRWLGCASNLVFTDETPFSKWLLTKKNARMPSSYSGLSMYWIEDGVSALACHSRCKTLILIPVFQNL